MPKKRTDPFKILKLLNRSNNNTVYGHRWHKVTLFTGPKLAQKTGITLD